MEATTKFKNSNFHTSFHIVLTVCILYECPTQQQHRATTCLALQFFVHGSLFFILNEQEISGAVVNFSKLSRVPWIRYSTAILKQVLLVCVFILCKHLKTRTCIDLDRIKNVHIRIRICIHFILYIYWFFYFAYF